jgi:stage V sporulation protein R
MPRVVSAAERIADYMAAHGRDRVEDFLTACHAAAIHQPQAQLMHRAPAPEPEHRPRDYDELFEEEVVAERARIAAERDALRRRFPREPEQDLLRFIEHNARGLEDWQRDVLSIVRSEQSYFLPQLRTKLLNEGAAVLAHQEICQHLRLATDQYWEYEQLNASVVAPQPGQANPYSVGVELLREIMRIAVEPDDEERERWGWAGQTDPFGRVRTVLRSYDDEGLLREFLTPRVCERCRLYAFERTASRPRSIRVSSREADTIRDLLVRQHSTFGIPAIQVVDADFRGRGELLLEHRHDGIGLDPEYARGTLVEVARLWGKPCTVRTVRGRDTDKPVWFTGHADGATDRRETQPGTG